MCVLIKHEHFGETRSCHNSHNISLSLNTDALQNGGLGSNTASTLWQPFQCESTFTQRFSLGHRWLELRTLVLELSALCLISSSRAGLRLFLPTLKFTLRFIRSRHKTDLLYPTWPSFFLREATVKFMTFHWWGHHSRLCVIPYLKFLGRVNYTFTWGLFPPSRLRVCTPKLRRQKMNHLPPL